MMVGDVIQNVRDNHISAWLLVHMINENVGRFKWVGNFHHPSQGRNCDYFMEFRLPFSYELGWRINECVRVENLMKKYDV